MLRILFLLKSYSTHDKQNALCVEGIANILKEKECLIDYISWENTNSATYDSNIFPISVDEKNTKSIIYKFNRLFNAPISDKQLVKAYYNKTNECLLNNKYDAVVAVINPAEAAEALSMIRRKDATTKFILYEIDPNSNRYKYPASFVEKLWKKRCKIWERKIYKRMDYIIHMESHRNHYSDSYFSFFNKKTRYSDIPNFIPKRISNKFPSSTPKLLYAGAFYPALREPYNMFKIIGLLKQRIDFSFDIYTGKSMRKEIVRLSNEYDMVNVHDVVQERELLDIICQSDILISVGNINSDFLPSKILMYMSTGKPILHFYNDDNDVSKRYLENYPLVFFIDERESFSESLMNELLVFISNSPNNIISDFKDLLNRFYKNTPEYTASLLLGLLE